MQSTSCDMQDWMNPKLELRLPGEIAPTSEMQMIPPLWQKVKRTEEPLDEGERRELKSWLKTQHSKNKDHGIQSHHFMANRCGNNGNSDKLYFLGSKITADGDCNLEISLLLERKAMTNLDSIFKRHYFADKGLYSQSYGFSSSHISM